MLEEKILKAIKKSILCWLATVDINGIPNVSPKEIFCFFEGHFLIANIASPGSAKNIRVNKHIALSFIDVLIQKGFQLKGTAQLITHQEIEFEHLSKPLIELTQAKYPFSSIFKIKIESWKPILAPSYIFYPEMELQEKIESAKIQYRLK